MSSAAVLILLTTAAAGPLPAAPPTVSTETARAVPARERPGLTISVGFGYGYGALGAQLRYDLPLRPWLHLAPFVAMGSFSDSGTRWMGGLGGVSAGLGRRHRLAVDLAVAPTTWERLSLHGTTVDVRARYGPTVGVGYEHVSDTGWFQRATIGYGWGLWAQGEGPSLSTVNLSLGVGMRAW